MSRRIEWFLTAVLSAVSSLHASPQVPYSMMTRPAPPSCSAALASLPQAYSTFAPTDTAAWLWFYTTGLNAGDVLSTAYYTPAGQLYGDPSSPSGAFEPTPTGGNYCFTDLPLFIAGYPAASMSGTWTVRVAYNGAPLFTLTFAIGSSAACSYTLSTNTASFGAGGGSGTVSITAGNGCPWSAAASVAWITTGSSGTGSGVAAYTVSANSGAAARTGALVVAGQTLTVTQAGAASPPSAGANLLINPGAETGPVSPDYTGLKSITGWTTDGNVTICAYAGTCSGTLVPTSPGPPDRGNNFFGGGYAATSTLSQVVDVSASAGAIDTGAQAYTLSGWLGGYWLQNDNTTVRAAFRDAAGNTLATAVIGPVSAADRANETVLLLRSTTGSLPAHTRNVLVTVLFTRTDGSANDGYGDNFYFGLGGPAAPACTYSVSPTTQSGGAAAMSGTVTVTAAAGCAWTAVSNSSWIVVTGGASGSGNGTVTYAVGANASSSSRIGTLTIAGQTVTVTQAGAPACTYSLTPTSAAIAATGGSGSIAVACAGGCSWTATSSASWLTITGGGSGSGNGTVTYAAAANTASSSRIGTLTIAGQTVTVTQAGAPACTYSLTPTSAAIAATGGSGSIAVACAGGCPWTATSGASWLTVTGGGSGSGNGTVTYAAAANTASSSRIGTLTIAGQTVTVTQAGAPACTYSLTPTSAAIAAAGGSGSIAVACAGGCSWTATSGASWLTVTGGGSGSGNGTVAYTASANGATSSRIAVITVAGQTFTAIQAGAPACTYSIAPAGAAFPAGGGTGTVTVTTAAACAWTTSSPVSWIAIDPGNRAGSGTLGYTVAATTSTSTRTATLTIAGQSHVVNQDAVPAPGGPAVTADGVLNYADGSTAFAPGTLLVIGGENLASGSATAGSNPLPTSLAGATVEVDCGGTTALAPLLQASPTTLAVQLPYEAAGPTARLRVRTAVGVSAWVTLAVLPQTPRVLVATGTSPSLALALHSDSTPVAAGMPAAAGETVQAQVIGLGITNPPATTGAGDPQGSQFAVSGVTVTVGSDAANVLSVALGPQPGIYLVSFEVPGTVVSGNYSFSVSAGGQASQADVFLPAGRKEITLYRLTNTDACSLTDSARFHLPQDAYISRLATWYQWGAGEQNTPARLSRGDGDLWSGNLARGSCDPFQTDWCEAVAPVATQAPADDYELRLERPRMCRNAASQDNGFATLWGVWQEAWTPAATVTVDGTGASIQTDGLKLALPPGPLPATVVNVSRMPGPFFRLENLGLADLAGATIQVALDPAMSGKVAVVVGEEDSTLPPMILAATVDNGVAQVTFPPIPTDASTGSAAPAARIVRARPAAAPQGVLADPNRIASRIGLLANITDETSPGGTFIIHYPATDINEPYMDQQPISRILEDAYGKLTAVGVDTSRRKSPIDAYVFSYAGPLGRIFRMDGGDAGTAETNIWGAQDVGLSINRDMVVDPRQAEEVRVTVGHELFHVLQAVYDPRPWLFSTLQSQWLWFQEASATWFEKKMSSQPEKYTPGNTRNYRWYLLSHGLEWLAGSLSSRDPIMHHGYGAASFLESLYPAGVNETPIGDLTRMMSQRSGLLAKTWMYTPVEAIRSRELSILPLKWRDYCVALFTGKVYPGIDVSTLVPPDPAAYPGLKIPAYTFRTGNDKGPLPDNWDAPDLSARLTLLQFRNPAASWNNVTLKITLTDPSGDAEVMAFSKPADAVTLVGRSGTVLRIPNIETYARNGTDLYIAAANGHGDTAPFAGTTSLQVKVELENSLASTRWVEALAMVGTGGLGYSDRNPVTPAQQVSWSGGAFTQEIKTTQSSPGSTVVDEWTAFGTVSPAGDMILQFTGRWTTTHTWADQYDSGEQVEMDEVILKNVPLVGAYTDHFNFGAIGADAANSFVSANRTVKTRQSDGTLTSTEFPLKNPDSVSVTFRIPPP